MVASVPGLTPDQAARILTKSEPNNYSPTGFSGVDPSEFGVGYPGGIPSGYYQG